MNSIKKYFKAEDNQNIQTSFNMYKFPAQFLTASWRECKRLHWKANTGILANFPLELRLTLYLLTCAVPVPSQVVNLCKGWSLKRWLWSNIPSKMLYLSWVRSWFSWNFEKLLWSFGINCWHSWTFYESFFLILLTTKILTESIYFLKQL